MKWKSFTVVGLVLSLAVTSLPRNSAFAGESPAVLRPPAVPLIACDPYFSVWSPADKLTDADTVHWTGKKHRLNSAVTIDGKKFRVLGKDASDVPALTQT